MNMPRCVSTFALMPEKPRYTGISQEWQRLTE
jgi:hypothetical protein